MFIDESGDLGLSGSKYLVLSCLILNNPDTLDRIIKNMRRYKFRKQLRKAQEIKASSSKPDLIIHMLKKINEIKNVNIHFIILEKGKLFSDFLKNDKHKLYNFIAGKLAHKIVINDYDVLLRIDKSKGKQILREDFNHYCTFRCIGV